MALNEDYPLNFNDWKKFLIKFCSSYKKLL